MPCDMKAEQSRAKVVNEKRIAKHLPVLASFRHHHYQQTVKQSKTKQKPQAQDFLSVVIVLVNVVLAR